MEKYSGTSQGHPHCAPNLGLCRGDPQKCRGTRTALPCHMGRHFRDESAGGSSKREQLQKLPERGLRGDVCSSTGGFLPCANRSFTPAFLLLPLKFFTPASLNICLSIPLPLPLHSPSSPFHLADPLLPKCTSRHGIVMPFCFGVCVVFLACKLFRGGSLCCSGLSKKWLVLSERKSWKELLTANLARLLE